MLPPDLPVPKDDGAAAHLQGTTVPSVAFPATTGGSVDVADAAQGTLVLFVYPRTGRPGIAPPPGWDATPGARGCTPQACAFRDIHAELAAAGAFVCGLSAQAADEQHEAAERLELPYPLLADPGLRLAAALGLPTFEFAGVRLYKRLTVVARAGTIVKVFYPVFPPDENASEVLDWLGTEQWPSGS